jgi:hypothetical protein
VSKNFLTNFPLTYADSISFEKVGTEFQIKILNSEHQLTIFLKDVLYLNFSNSLVEFMQKNSDEDWIDIVNITHEYRQPNQQDLRHYEFLNGEIEQLPCLHFITLYGDIALKTLCREVEVVTSP